MNFSKALFEPPMNLSLIFMESVFISHTILQELVLDRLKMYAAYMLNLDYEKCGAQAYIFPCKVENDICTYQVLGRAYGITKGCIWFVH